MDATTERSLTPHAWTILATVAFGVLVVDHEGEATYANPAWTRLTGSLEAAWRGRGWQAQLAAAPELLQRFIAVGAAGQTSSLVVDVGDGGAGRVLQLDVAHDPGVLGTLLVVTARDVTAERAAEEELRRVALRDPLTGLWNRNRFHDFLVQALTRQEREPERRAAVFFVDVDDLKSENDEHGHAAGDHLLRGVAACLVAAVRPGDVVARHGGDEFTILCDDVDEEQARDVARRVVDEVAESSDVNGTISLGVALSSSSADDPDGIISRADFEMYRSKRDRDRSAVRGPVRPTSDRRPPDATSGATELIWTIGAFARLLRKQWVQLGPEDRADTLDAIVRLVDRLQQTVGAEGEGSGTLGG